MSFNPKWLIGRTVVSVEMNPYRARDAPQDRSIAYNPVITLDNGAQIRFVAQETDGSEYGVAIVYNAVARKAAS